jgi:hypothetical protein
VVREQREQQLLAEGVGRGPAADAFEPIARRGVERRLEQAVHDQPGFQQTLELGVGPSELIQGGGEHSVRLVTAQLEELTAEQKRGLGSGDPLVDQGVRVLQVGDRRVAVHMHLRRAEFEQQVGALAARRRFGKRSAQIGDGGNGPGRGGPTD